MKDVSWHGVVLVAQEGQILYHEARSYEDAPVKASKEGAYPIASLTKQFTAAALLKALAYHKLSPSMCVTHFFPDHPSVTLHQLLTHTATGPYVYSNQGYVTLGKVIEALVQEPLDCFFKRELFEPAGMMQTSLPLSGSPQIPGYVREGGAYQEASNRIQFEKSSTAGAMVSTARDLMAWNEALYGGRILSPDLLKMMTTKHTVKKGDLLFDGWTEGGYGYGLDISENSYQHCGGLPGYQARLSYHPQTKRTFVNLSNVSEEKPAIFEVMNGLTNESILQ